jgi:hypothetical protein
MADEIGAARGRPILLVARTPDEPRYAKGLGMDIERWMREDLIDIWVATGYFRLQEWADIVKLAHGHGVPVWASMDDVRTGRPNAASAPASRARAMNMWNAGVDGIFVFNFGDKPPSAKFNLLHEMGDPVLLARLPKMYVPDARGDINGVKWFLKGGEEYVTKRNADALPHDLGKRRSKTIELLVGDDLRSAKAQGLKPAVELKVYISGLTDARDLELKLNGRRLAVSSQDAGSNLVQFDPVPEQIKKGFNKIEVKLAARQKVKQTILEDLQLWVNYE